MFIGIEIGGTKLQAGLGVGDGVLQAVERSRADAGGGAGAIRAQVLQLVARLLERSGAAREHVTGVGVGFGGPVDAETGCVARSHQVSGWEGFPLAAWLHEQLGWPTVVHNDADTAGLAEAHFGAGRDRSPMFYITIGSGIGGGLITNCRIYRGAGAGAAEIGHLTIPDSRLLLPPGPDAAAAPSPATVESVCSGWSIGRRMRDAVERIRLESEDATLRSEADAIVRRGGGTLQQVTAEVVAETAAEGNRLAQNHLEHTWQVLAWAVNQVVTLLCPQRVVIGGGVSAIGERGLFRPLREAVAQETFPPFRGICDIVPGALGEAVVLHGGVLLARNRRDGIASVA